MDGPSDSHDDTMKHCQGINIKICTICGSKNIKIQDESITCHDCNAILCYEHKKET